MENYPQFISEKRRPTTSPEKLVQNGTAVFGTFDKPISTINLVDCLKPCGEYLPHFMNRARLTLWEAFEVDMDEISLVSAVYNLGAVGFSIFVVHDKRNKKTYSWVNPTAGINARVAENLINSVSALVSNNSYLIIDNQFQDGKAHGKGNAHSKKDNLEFDFKIDSLSPPSIVSIPLGENKPLYSHKEFFKAQGYLTLNGEKFTSNERTVVIIDDHKGFYPFKMHYDWLTTMGMTEIDGQQKYLAFNLTHNQSTTEDDYNENLLWIQGDSCPLPPVTFEKICKTKWYIKDKYDMVNLVFDVASDFQMQVHLKAIDVDYTLPFGTISGYVKDVNGKKYILDGMAGIGEDRSQQI